MILVVVSLTAGLLVSCQPATDDTPRLQLLEWNGYQQPYYYPEYVAKCMDSASRYASGLGLSFFLSESV